MPTKKRTVTPRSYIEPPPSIITKNVKEAAAQINELNQKLTTEQQGRTDTFEHMISLFTGKHDLGIPNDKRYVTFDAKSSKPSDVIFRVMGMLLAELRCQYVNMSKRRDDADKADRIEAHLNALYPTLFRRNQERWDIQSLFWQLLVGVSYLQQTHLPFYWDKNELRRKPHEVVKPDDDSETTKEKDLDYNDRTAGYREITGPPIMVESLDPRMIREVRTKGKGIVAWVKKYHVTRYDFAEGFRARNKRATFDVDGNATIENGVAGMEYAETADIPMSESVDYYEYIDSEFVYYVVNDRVVDKFHHRGGIRIFPSYGLQTGLNEPQYSSVGILWPVRNEVVQLDFYKTLWANKAFLEIFPQLFAILDGKDDPLRDEDGSNTEWTLEPGTIKQIRGQLINAMKDAASGTDFRALVEDTSSGIDSSTISGIARGQAGAQQPGYSINQLAQAMRTLWKVIIESRELQFSSMYEHYLWMVKNVIKQETSAFAEGTEDPKTGRRTGDYITVKPDDIDDYFRVEANLQPDLPIDKQGQINLYASLYERSLVDWDTYVRDGLGKNNPERLLRKIRKEAMEKETLGKAIEDAQKLGQVRLQNAMLKEAGFPDLNDAFMTDVQLIKGAREGEQPQMNGLGPDGQPMMPPQPGAPPAAPQGQPAAGPPPTFGASPADSSPGPRMGDMSSGNGLR